MRTPGRTILCLGLLVSSCLAADGPPEGSGTSDHGDCVAVGVYYRMGSGSDQYVVGPDHCVYRSHWSSVHEESVELGHESAGAVGVDLSVPAP